MNHEQFGTVDAYLTAFQAIQAEGIHENHLALLQTHFDAPDHTTIYQQLAEKVGYT